LYNRLSVLRTSSMSMVSLPATELSKDRNL
jgi:hypothetical protein